MKHPLLTDWASNRVTKLMFCLLDEYKAELIDAVINSDGLYSEAGIKHLAKLVGQIQLIDKLKDIEEFFPGDKLEMIGEE